MTSYNPKNWISFIFSISKAETFLKLIPMMLIIGAYCGVVAYVEIEYNELPPESLLKNLTLMHGMLGFVISLLLAYRTNSAYDRWWEGRKIWGSLVNSSRNLALKLSVVLTDEKDIDSFRKLIPSYAAILSKHLSDEEIAQELFDSIKIESHKHYPNQIAKMLFAKVNELYSRKIITGDQLLSINAELTNFTDACGACERIKNTPIPYSYSAFIKKFIFIYVLTLPYGYVFNLGYYMIPVVVFVFYVLASLELIAQEIEDPFGNDTNDLPTHKISENIKKNIEEIFQTEDNAKY